MGSSTRVLRVVISLALRADRRLATRTFGLAVIENVVDATHPLWLKLLTEAVVAEDAERALVIAFVLALAYLGGAAARNANYYLLEKLANKTGQCMDEEIMRCAAGISGIEHYERPEYLDRLDLLHAERGRLASYTKALVQGIGTTVRVAATIAVLASVHPALALLSLAAVPSLVTNGMAQRIAQRLLERLAERSRLLAYLTALATTTNPAKEVRIFRLRDELVRRMDQLQTEIRREELRSQSKSSVLSFFGSLFFVAGQVGAVLFVLDLATGGAATVGDVVLVASLARDVNMLAAAAASFVATTVGTGEVVGRYLWLLDYGTAQLPASPTSPVPDRLVDGIELDGVSFAYPGTDRRVLHDVTFRLRAGTTVALVGDNGAGKTTIVKLLSGFYAPTAGSIKIDGRSLSTFEMVEWRKRLSAGFQDFARFEVLVREAVGVGDLEVAENVDAVLHAMDRASARELAAQLPNGVETQLGRAWESGVELSGGQWQKVALARSMMREVPLLLVLDEPTSALDADAEHTLFERYAEATRRVAAVTGGITLLVSHRFSTVRMADLVVVMDSGRVVEVGTHEQLMGQDGIYREMYELQARSYR
jgi:ATP-binding cassette subfamily B protein